MRAFESLAAEGRLPLRVYAMLSARDEALCRAWLARGPQRETSRMLTVRSVKAFEVAYIVKSGFSEIGVIAFQLHIEIGNEDQILAVNTHHITIRPPTDGL